MFLFSDQQAEGYITDNLTCPGAQTLTVSVELRESQSAADTLRELISLHCWDRDKPQLSCTYPEAVSRKEDSSSIWRESNMFSENGWCGV